jgi:uncharacterized protein
MCNGLLCSPGNLPMRMIGIGFFVGLVSGAVGGLIGLGGGIIMVPLLTGLMNLDRIRAHGTSLAALVFTGFSGAAAYACYEQIDWTAAVALAFPAVLTAAAGARLADALPAWKLKRAFGGFLFLCSLLLLLKPFMPSGWGPLSGYALIGAMTATGAVTGFLSGLLGVGGGLLMVPAMIFFAGFSQYAAQGTALLVMIPTGMTGAVTHFRFGNVAIRLLYGIAPGILLGAFLGGNIAQFIPEDLLCRIFVLSILLMGWRYIKAEEPPELPESVKAAGLARR